MTDEQVRRDTIEECAAKLAEWYPDNANTNAFCAAIRSLATATTPPAQAEIGEEEIALVLANADRKLNGEPEWGGTLDQLGPHGNKLRLKARAILSHLSLRSGVKEGWQPDAVGVALAERQRIVVEWGARCFGADYMADKIVRAARFFEEAAEFAQSVGLTREHALRAFEHVYSREPGDPAQESGGVANTHMALCGALGLSFDECQKAEIARCLAKDPAHFSERNKAKLRDVDTAPPQKA